MMSMSNVDSAQCSAGDQEPKRAAPLQFHLKLFNKMRYLSADLCSCNIFIILNRPHNLSTHQHTTALPQPTTPSDPHSLSLFNKLSNDGTAHRPPPTPSNQRPARISSHSLSCAASQKEYQQFKQYHHQQHRQEYSGHHSTTTAVGIRFISSSRCDNSQTNYQKHDTSYQRTHHPHQ